MTIEEIKRELEYLAILSKFDFLDIKKIKELFDQLINNGIYYNEFLDLEDPRYQKEEDFIPIFKSALEKIDIMYPQNNRAISNWFILKYHLKKIVYESQDAIKEFLALKLYLDYMSIKLRDFYGINELYSIYYNDIDTDYPYRSENEITLDIIHEAKKWLEKHSDDIIQKKIRNPILRIFIVGANGFIGSYITAKLLKEGHEVICAVRDVEATRLKFSTAEIINFDFNNINLENLRSALGDIDVVVNVAGLLKSSGKNQIDNVHYNGPKALFDECIKARVSRIIHISALGIDSENTTEYALSKKLTDNYLKTLYKIDWVILQPSLVYASGCYGGTSLFRALSALPYFIPLVGDGSQKFQPIHMDDLTAIVSFCVKKKDKIQRVIKLVGPEVVAVKEILISFRRWLGLKSAKLIKIPLSLIKISAKIGDLIGSNILNSVLYKMMMIPNIADKNDMINYTGIVPRSFEKGLDSDPLTVQSLWHARLYLLKPALRIILSLFWVASGVIAGIIAPDIALESMKDIGLNQINASIILYFSCFIDVTLGVILLFSKEISKICLIQIATILCYTLILSVLKSDLWLEPLGSLLKNIPIILLTLVLIAIEREK